MRRGFFIADYEGEKEPFVWPYCEITNCPNGICFGMSKSLCYQHGIEFGAFTKEEFELNRKSKHARISI